MNMSCVCRVCRVCRVVQGSFFQPNTVKDHVIRALYGSVLGVQGCRARGRVCAQFFGSAERNELFSMRPPKKPAHPAHPAQFKLKD